MNDASQRPDLGRYGLHEPRQGIGVIDINGVHGVLVAGEGSKSLAQAALVAPQTDELSAKLRAEHSRAPPNPGRRSRHKQALAFEAERVGDHGLEKSLLTTPDAQFLGWPSIS